MRRDTCNQILRPIAVPFLHAHHPTLQHDCAQPHVARFCTQFLSTGNIQRPYQLYAKEMCCTGGRYYLVFWHSKIYSGLLWWAAWGTTIIILSNQTYMHILSIKAAMRAICSITRQREGGWHQRATWKRFTDRRWISCTPSSHSQYKGHSSSEQQWF